MTSRNLLNVGGTEDPDMTQGLDHGAGRTSRRDEVLGRSVPKIDDALAQHNPTGGAISEVGTLCRNLRRQTELIGCTSTSDLHLRTRLPRQCVGHIIRCR
ncbi:hypothetical protein TSO5_15585 [Azospirillum sp. TSO5]|nr:hypothetical protein TSO5_15585 [Azospirillum sp. TSO5]